MNSDRLNIIPIINFSQHKQVHQFFFYSSLGNSNILIYMSDNIEVSCAGQIHNFLPYPISCVESPKRYRLIQMLLLSFSKADTWVSHCGQCGLASSLWSVCPGPSHMLVVPNQIHNSIINTDYNFWHAAPCPLSCFLQLRIIS